MFHVLVPQSIAVEGIQLLEKNQCRVTVLEDSSQHSIQKAAPSADAILIRTAPLTKSIIESADNVKVIARHGIGVDNIDLKAALAKGITVCNTPTANINAVAEYVIGVMFHLSRWFVEGDKAVREGRFAARNTLISTELKGKMLALIGCGNIGKLVAKKCYSLGIRVEAYDPYVKEAPPGVTLTEDLSALLQKADFVSLHLPFTPETRHFMDEKKLKRMNPSAILINAARDGIVDEDALYQALKERTITGAALDCFEEEPVQPGHPLWELDNTVYTPHMAAHTNEAMTAMAVEAAKEIVRVKDGSQPQNSVQPKERG